MVKIGMVKAEAISAAAAFLQQRGYLPGVSYHRLSPPLDPAASHMLEQYLAYIAARGWFRMVLETRGGVERFDHSCRPSNPISGMPKPTCSLHPATQKSTKCRLSVRKHERERQRRIAWVERRKQRAEDTGGLAPAVTG
jgi:hypothetical protein